MSRPKVHMAGRFRTYCDRPLDPIKRLVITQWAPHVTCTRCKRGLDQRYPGWRWKRLWRTP